MKQTGIILVFLSNVCLAQIKITTLTSSSLPKSIQYTGHIINAVRWMDSVGDNIVVTTETGNIKSKPSSDEAYKDAALYAYHYQVKGDNVKLTWKVSDFINECDLDLNVSFIKNTFSVTDLDKDGKAEVWIMYEIQCTGDVSPGIMKIIMYEDGKKCAVRGTRKTRVSEKEYAGGEYFFDEAFKNGPEVFRKYASQLWKKNILKRWE